VKKTNAEEGAASLRLNHDRFSSAATQTSQMLVDGETNEAVSALAESIETLTTRLILQRLIEEREHGRKFEIPVGFFSLDELELLKRVGPPTGRRPTFYAVNHNSVTGCPRTSSCGVKLPPDVIRTLKTRRVAQCVQCKTVMVSVTP